MWTEKAIYALALLAFTGATVWGCGEAETPEEGFVADCAEAVPLDHGVGVRGRQATGDGCAYKGVRYAKALTAGDRFRPPRPLDPGTGIRAATAYGPLCPQEYTVRPLLETDGVVGVVGEEDCLFLNVWRPREAAPGSGRPVMVFLHGGAFTVGAGSWPQYEGWDVNAHGVVVVTVNYRLGPLGFLALPELAGEDQVDGSLDGTYGNYGLLDQVMALEWVRANIDAFGGDPENVTIFGESAGAMSVCTLMASPKAAGLFQRAIMQSGGCTGVGTEVRSFAQGQSFVTDAGCGAALDPVACLRDLEIEELYKRASVDIIADGYHPHLDGVVLDLVPQTALQTGEATDVPLIAGANADEVRPVMIHPPTLAYRDASWTAFWDRVAEIYGEQDARRLAELYPKRSFENPLDLWAELQSDRILKCPTQMAAMAHRGRRPTFHYDFRWDETPMGDAFGAFHALELGFVFGVFEAWDHLYGWDLGPVKELSDRIQRYWTRFARHGDPNGPGDPRWPGYESGRTMILDRPMPDPVQGLRAERCAFWAPRTPLGLDRLTGGVADLGGGL